MDRETQSTRSEVLHSTVNGPLLQGQNVYVGQAAPLIARPPRQLPAVVATFTGRADHLAELDHLLTTHETAAPGAVVLGAIVGTAGVGKTELAVRWAHRVADRFPHGQLFVDLHGFTPGMSPLAPGDALPVLLRALGVPREQVPEDLDEQSALYRAILSDRRVLIVLDNVAAAEQVRPLIPGTRGCLVLITSRHDLADVASRHDLHRITLPMLTADEAVTLLTQLLGVDRAAADRQALTALAELCACLPLALRIAAAYLAVRPRRNLRRYVEMLARGDRLSMLTAAGTDPQAAVRAIFDISYQDLGADARRLFRRLGLVPGPSITPPAGAHLVGASSDEASRMFDALVAAHLLEPIGEERFACHDLLRLYARERAEAEDTTNERSSALLRLFDFYRLSTDAAVSRRHAAPTWISRPTGHEGVTPLSFTGDADAAIWLDEERLNLAAIIGFAADHGTFPNAWHIVDALRDYFWTRGYGPDWLAVGRAGLAIARRIENKTAEATMHLSLGQAYWGMCDHSQSTAQLEQALSQFRHERDERGEAASLNFLGGVCWESGRLDAAVSYLLRILEISLSCGDRYREAATKNNLGITYRDLGQLDLADETLKSSFAVSRETAYLRRNVFAAMNLASVFNLRGSFSRAEVLLKKALHTARNTNARLPEAKAMTHLALLYEDTNRQTEAISLSQNALELSREIGNGRIEANALNALAVALGDQRVSRYDEAVRHHGTALTLAQGIDARVTEIEAYLGLAEARCRLGDVHQARQHAVEGLRLARESGYRVHEARALAARSAIAFGKGDYRQACDDASQAVGMYASMKCRQGEARSLVALGRATIRDRGAGAGREIIDRAVRLFVELGLSPDADEARALVLGPDAAAS